MADIRKISPVLNKPQIFVAMAVILWTFFVWGNSLLDVSESLKQSLFIEHIMSSILDFLQIPEEVRQVFVRKGAHVTEYAVLGLLWMSSLSYINKAKLSPVFALGICILTATIDETIQRFVPGRGCAFRDVLFDSLGASLAITIVYGVLILYNKRQRALHSKKNTAILPSSDEKCRGRCRTEDKTFLLLLAVTIILAAVLFGYGR